MIYYFKIKLCINKGVITNDKEVKKIVDTQYDLAKDSVVLLEQLRTIDKKRLREKIGHLDSSLMTTVNDALSISFGLSEF